MDEKESALVVAVRELTAETRRARRWRTAFAAVPFLVLLLILLAVLGGESSLPTQDPHTARIDVFGPIVPQAPASAEFVNQSLRAAFEEEQAKAVVLRINSPGGSPVQADRINAEIQRLKAEYPDKKVYAVVEDLCASAAYYIAVAADEIYVNGSSLVGSIGVIASGFGLVELIQEWGIERRVTTSGRHKAMLDPFLPLDPEAEAHFQGMVDLIHQQFEHVVKEARGDRLTAVDEEVFDGRIWTGNQAREMGLVDGFSDVAQIARDLVGAEEVVDYTYEPDFLERVADRVGTRLGQIVESWLRTPVKF